MWGYTRQAATIPWNCSYTAKAWYNKHDSPNTYKQINKPAMHAILSMISRKNRHKIKNKKELSKIQYVT